MSDAHQSRARSREIVRQFDADHLYCPTCRAHFLAPVGWEVHPPYSLSHADDGYEHRHPITGVIFEEVEDNQAEDNQGGLDS